MLCNRFRFSEASPKDFSVRDLRLVLIIKARKTKISNKPNMRMTLNDAPPFRLAKVGLLLAVQIGL